MHELFILGDENPAGSILGDILIAVGSQFDTVTTIIWLGREFHERPIRICPMQRYLLRWHAVRKAISRHCIGWPAMLIAAKFSRRLPSSRAMQETPPNHDTPQNRDSARVRHSPIETGH